jgi:hypothetical protein
LALALATATTAASATPTSACLPQTGHITRNAIRGVHVGSAADMPPRAVSASYCVTDGGTFSFAVDPERAVVLVVTDSPSDRVREIAPGSAARGIDRLRQLGAARTATLYKLDGDNQLVVGVEHRRVAFIAAADRLLLESRGKLSYWLGRLGY